MKVYKKIAKTFFSVLFCIALVTLSGCDGINRMIGSSVVPESVTIEGITYRNGFYGEELCPLFDQVGDVGAETLQEGVFHDDGYRKFRRVDFEGHDWVHSNIGKYTGGVVYCAESEWEQTKSYYKNPENFDYYYDMGYYMSQNGEVLIPKVDFQKFEELLAFGRENNYEPFDSSSNKKVMEKTCRIPESEFQEGFCFYKVSKDGYFTTSRGPRYFVYDDKLFLVFYHDGENQDGEFEEVVSVEVPNELSQYFVEVLEKSTT